ncbi:hypothetical protein EN35_09260 [Rhodococcus qingshengii]|nr:hypothetical protein EN35_09260 [Rhodococcus qingshengii]
MIARALLVSPTDDVVGDDATGGGRIDRVQVVTHEQWHNRQTLHRCSEISSNHRRKSIGLAVEREWDAFDLLVMFELDREEPDQFDCDPGRTGNTRSRVVVRDVHLLHVTAGDEIAHRRSAITREQNTTRIADRDDGGAVRSYVSPAHDNTSCVGEAVLRKMLRCMHPKVFRE